MAPHPPQIQIAHDLQMVQRLPSWLDQLTTPLVEEVTPPANRLIDLLITHYPAFEQTQPLQAHVRKAMRLITACHTSALGGHVECCPHGHITRVFYNGCGHRFCPRCAGRKRRAWLVKRQATLLPVRHYHVVFTVSHAFNALWRRNPKILGTLLFHSATDALRALLTDPRHLGAEPGITMTLETWDELMFLHPHGHCLVTGGGITPEGEWKDVPNPRCLVPVRPLMWEFRKRFCRGLEQALRDETLTLPEGTTTRHWLNRLTRVNRQKWEVFIAPPPEDGGPTTPDLLRYQARDVAGGPLSGDRLVSSPSDLSATQLAYLKASPLSVSRLEEATEDRISFWYGAYDRATGRRDRTQLETLPVDEFLSRYLQHVPPPRYQTVRHYGLYTSAKKAAYEHCREVLVDRQPLATPDTPTTEPAPDTDAWIEAHTCPVCGEPLVVTAHVASTRTGTVIPRVPIGHVFAHAPPTTGGSHAP
jgi:hypothetical protein